MFQRINRFEKCLIDLHSYRRLIKNYFTFVKKKCPRGETVDMPA